MRVKAALSLILFLVAGCASETIDDSIVGTPSGLYWQRCAIGLEWNGVTCDGEAERLEWDAAAEACRSFGPGYRLPTLEELTALLGECSTEGPAQCAPCAESATCASVLADPDYYGWTWTADPAISGAMVVDLDRGVIAYDEAASGFYTRCVTETP